MEEIIQRNIDLPTTIRGYTIRDHNGDYNIYINARMTTERQIEAYRHELKHIRNGDFNRTGSVDLIEIHAHRRDGVT